MIHRLRNWLEENRARKLRVFKDGDASIVCYVVNGHQFMLLEYEEDGAWDIYIPAHQGNSVSLTLDALTKYCGIPADEPR